MAKQRTPEAVLAAAKRADELHKSLYGTPDDGAQQEPAGGVEAQTPESAPEGGTIQPVEPAATPPGPDTSAPPPPPAEPAPQPEPPKEDWEAKYKALQGKYNSEVPRLAADLRAMKAQLDELQKARATPPAAPQEEPKKDIVSKDDLEEYGEDLVNLIRRVARAEAAQIETTLKPKIEQVEGRVVETVQRQATQSVYSVLDRDVQDWREINKSPEFIEWLSQSDPYVGDTRRNLLMGAFQEGDADRVAAFFKGYKAQRTIVAPPPPAPPAAPAPAPAVTLEQLAGPAAGPTGAAPMPVNRQAQIITRAEVQKFYADVAAGAYRRNPEEKARIEAQIAAALKDNRIQ